MSSAPDSEQFLAELAPHRDALYRYARLMCWDRSRAEDVLQEAIMAAFQAFGRFEPGTNFRAWMFRFLHNTLLNENRKIRRQPVYLDTSEPLVSETLAAAHDVPVYNLQEANEHDSFLQQLSDPVKQALLLLGEAERTVFLLRTIEEFSYREIAELMGIPEGTAMSHLHRGVVKLRHRLDAYARQQRWPVSGSPDQQAASSQGVSSGKSANGQPQARQVPRSAVTAKLDTVNL